MENIKETLTQQNTQIDIREGCFEPKFSYKTKRGTRNLVVEVDAETSYMMDSGTLLYDGQWDNVI